MDAISLNVMKTLQEYANLYFEAILKINEDESGECTLRPGNYSAKDLNENKGVLEGCTLPEDEIFNENIEIEEGTFKCKFPYRQIFRILAQWESVFRAGKKKTVFKIDEVEEKSVNVILSERTELGAFKSKRIKLQRIGGNWWAMPKEIRKGYFTGYYELNGVMFAPGKQFWGKAKEESNKRFIEKYNDKEMIKNLIKFLSNESYRGEDNHAYFSEVARLAGIDMESEEAKAIATVAKEEQRKLEEENARELAERNAREEETRRKRLEMEERIKREAAERLEKAKERFLSGKIISREEFEDIAASIDYEINIRTVGTLRKRITWIETRDGDNVTVYGTKTRRGLDGTFTVIREVYAKLKESMPEPVKHISEIIETCCLFDNNGEETDEYRYYKWLTNAHCGHYQTIAQKALAEILTGMFLAAYRKGKGHILAMNEYGVLLDNVITQIEPPQPPQISEMVNYATEPTKCATEPRKEPKRTVYVFIAHEPRTVKSQLMTKIVPRCSTRMNCSTAYRIRGDTRKIISIPIRGDCKARILVKSKPPDMARSECLTDFKPP